MIIRDRFKIVKKGKENGGFGYVLHSNTTRAPFKLFTIKELIVSENYTKVYSIEIHHNEKKTKEMPFLGYVGGLVRIRGDD